MELPVSNPASLKYDCIVLKVSGEAFGGKSGDRFDARALSHIVSEIVSAHRLGVRLGIVVGGGNIYRGHAAEAAGSDRVTSDYMGMLATVINSLALQDLLEREGVPTRVLTAIEINRVAEPYIRRRAQRHLDKGRVVILAAGTGNPYFTTDTAAALRAVELRADAVVKGTKVDGVYDSDPEINPDAVRFKKLGSGEVLNRGLRVMDLTAVALCQENGMPIEVFDITGSGNLVRLLHGEDVGTTVTPEGL
jgi:uridylate kinase